MMKYSCVNYDVLHVFHISSRDNRLVCLKCFYVSELDILDWFLTWNFITFIILSNIDSELLTYGIFSTSTFM